MKRCFITGAMLVGMALVSQAQNYVNPAEKISSASFAVITDPATFSNCSHDIAEYQAVLGSEGLPTFVVYDDWKSPEDVKKVIAKLHKSKKLEGVLFVGKIPIPMIRKAQHMTSAFKMDEVKYPRRESSVPSDRFYDDFSLKFDFIGQDSVDTDFFYYNLAVDSPQQIKCDIYSARVKAVDSGEDPYAQISRFFRKAVAEHKAVNPLDQFFSYTGNGSYSNSLTAWTPEAFTLREQMPGVFDRNGRARFMRYNFSDYPKDDVINQLKRDDLDLAIFHEHGLSHRMYLSGSAATEGWTNHVDAMKLHCRSMARRDKSPKALADIVKKLDEKYGLDSTWIAGYDDPEVIAADSLIDLQSGIILTEVTEFKPNSRMVIFDACYNGDFREPDFIAGRFVMSEGKCVTAFANSVNVLQDKMANEMLGLLGMGARVGQWARLTNILESHIIGDPTLRFDSFNEVDASKLAALKYNEAQTLKMLESPYPDVQNLALHTLYRNGYRNISDLLAEKFSTSPFMMVRYTSLALLQKLNDDNFRKVLPLALRDSYEFIRRSSVRMMQHVGLDEYAYPMVKSYFDDNLSERVAFDILMALPTLSEQAVTAAIELAAAESFLLDDQKEEHRKLLVVANNKRSTQRDIFDYNTPENYRALYCNSMKNHMGHSEVDGFIRLINDPAESENVRLSLIQALAWFNYSHRRADIMDACKKISSDSKQPEAIRDEALRTYYRLKY